MAEIPSGTKFLGVGSSVPTPELSGTAINSKTQYYTIEDLQGLIRPYKVYSALLTQSGTASPVATVLENTIGNIVWTRNAAGQYSATLSSAFTLNKTFVLLGRSGANTGAYFEQNWVSANAVDIFSVNYGGFNLDDTMYLVPIEIRVYN